MQTRPKCITLVASLAVAWASASSVYGQATQLGSQSDRNGYRVAQYTEPGVVQPGMVQPGTVIGQPGQDVYDNGYDSGGWTGCTFGVPCGQSCQGTGSGIIAGGGVYYIKPFFSDNQAAVMQSTAANPTTITRVGLINHYNIAPFAFLGFVGPNGFGIRARASAYDHGSDGVAFTVPANTFAAAQAPLNPLFNFNNIPPPTPAVGAVPFNPFVANPGAAFTASSGLQAYVFDLEATQAIDHEHWTWGFSGGARYAILRQQYNAQTSFTPPAIIAVFPTQTQSLSSTRQSDGIGPTVAIEGKRTFGQTGLAMYANARGSLLFGNTQQNVTFTTTNIAGNPAPTQYSASWGQASVLPILELEAGPEYSAWLGTLRLFVRAGVFGQAWLEAGNASNAGLTTLADNHATLGFFGLRLTGGLDY